MMLEDKGTWAHAHPDRKWDTDNYDDMYEIYELSLERAKKYKIEGLTYEISCGVVKNIIPAIGK